MNWNALTEISQLEAIKKESYESPVLIFKHSTTCSISQTALARLERNWKPEGVENLKIYYLDLLKNRQISNQIASIFEVVHESPQVLLVENGICTYDASHFAISYQEIKDKLSKKSQ
ncbi:MAG: bacillithiol system redox-active protein YtxJ [Pseudarcicella sp.]|nr:bacillithiol system redox-active protein YtxJ [Pseudarcicella sp.]